jgi:protein-S-isoprenylcysteine O-methyltransferase Ste14
MPRAALAGYLAFLLVAFVWRTWLQHRRTGDAGFRGFRGNVAVVERVAGVLLVLGFVASFLAPVLALAGMGGTAPGLDHPAVHALGAALMAAGFVVTVVAQLDMGASWRIGVDPGERTALVTHGLFRRVRNPIYTGMLAATLGVLFLVPGVPSLAGFALALLGLEIHVRKVEEPHLLRAHGDHYRAYARAVGRFVPGIGRLP